MVSDAESDIQVSLRVWLHFKGEEEACLALDNFVLRTIDK